MRNMISIINMKMSIDDHMMNLKYNRFNFIISVNFFITNTFILYPKDSSLIDIQDD